MDGCPYRRNHEESDLVGYIGCIYCSFVSSEKSIDSLIKEAEQGDTAAQSSLGVMDSILPQDKAEAEKWYRKAAEQGDVYLQQNWGI